MLKGPHEFELSVHKLERELKRQSRKNKKSVQYFIKMGIQGNIERDTSCFFHEF